MLVTLGLTVFVDLITAVAVGLILAGFATARWMETEELKGVTSMALPKNDEFLSDDEKQELAKHNGRIAVVMLRGRFSYASARELVQRVGADTTGQQAVVFDFSEAVHLDTSVALAIEGLIEVAGNEGASVFVSGLSGTALITLNSLDVLKKLPADHLYDSRLDAFAAAGKSLTG